MYSEITAGIVIGGLIGIPAYIFVKEYWLNGEVSIVYEGGLSRKTVTRRQIRDSGYTVDELERFEFLPI